MRKIFVAIVAAVFVISLLSAQPGTAGVPLPVGKMKAALRTATPEEDGFIERVSDLVVQDVLPRKMVETTFLWARKKPEHKFQYFKRGLIVRAAEIGVKVQ